MSGRKKNLDPLFQLFEHHLLTRSYEDSAAFTKEVAKEYLNYLDSTMVHVPMHVRQSIAEDLEAEAHEMLIKKMYGVHRTDDHQGFGKVAKLEGKKERVGSFEFVAPEPPPEDTKKS